MQKVVQSYLQTRFTIEATRGRAVLPLWRSLAHGGGPIFPWTKLEASLHLK